MLYTMIHVMWCRQRSYTVPELAHLLLVIVGSEQTRSTEGNWDRCPSSRLNDSWDCRSEENHAVAQRELCAVILVPLDQIAYVDLIGCNQENACKLKRL